MPGVPRELAEHRLRVDSSAKPVKEHLRRSAVQKQAIGEEVSRLLAAEFIREVYHSEWLANVVLVPKKDDSLRMCIDFKHTLQKKDTSMTFWAERIFSVIHMTLL